VLPEVQQLVTAVMGTLDDQALHTLLDHLTVVRQAITAAPTDLPPPAPRRTPPSCAVPEPGAPTRQPLAQSPPSNLWVVVAQVVPGPLRPP
jgi:hypothetical protein